MSFNKGGSMTTLDRITQQPDMMGGKACIRGMLIDKPIVLFYL
jgi:uncharacterized protein (DUF433 family)